MDLSKLTLGSTPINLKAPLPTRATLANKPFSLNAGGRLNPLPSQTQSTAVAPTSPSPKITKFAQMIKEKYPQYADVDDEELAKMVLEKYPVYADKLDRLDTVTEEPKKKESLLKTLLKSAADVVLQPARFLERTGKAIGTFGMSDNTKAKVEQTLGPGLQQRIGGEEYATPAYKTGGEFLGGAVQTAANLATPFALNPAGMALQSGALSAGKTLEEGGNAKDAAISGAFGTALGYGVGRFGPIVGKAVGTPIKETAFKVIRPIAKKIAPMFTGATKQELAMAFDEFPEITLRNLEIIKNAPSKQEAEATLRSTLLKNVKTVVREANDAMEAKFGNKIDFLNKKYSEARANVPGIALSIKNQLPKFGQPLTDDETRALEAVLKTLQNPQEYTLSGARVLSSDLWSIVQRTEQGTPARRAAQSAWAQLRDEMSRMTKGEIDPLFKEYAKFKTNYLNLKPVWGERVNEDTARNFVANLSSNSKTAARDALVELEKLAGLEGKASPEITLYRLAQRLAKDEKITGSRLTDILGAGALVYGGGAAGELIGGDTGSTVGSTIGILFGAKMLSPSVISDILLAESKSAGTMIAPALREKLSEILSNPLTAQVIMRAINRISEESLKEVD